VNGKVKAKALSTLDGMREIVRNEMLTRGVYLTDVEEPDLAKSGALCGGRRACLLGSAWIAYGIKPDEKWDELPGVDEGERSGFLRHRPALKAVYDALNLAAERKLARDPGLCRAKFDSPAEALFEGNYRTGLDRGDVLRLIASARREIVKS
jgi:hypothetical protein